MNLPDKVNIGGIPYTVLFVDEVAEIETYNGLIIYNKQLIKIKNDLPDETTGKVFLHEVLHGVIAHCEIDFVDKDENYVSRIANALYQVLSDNRISFWKSA